MVAARSEANLDRESVRVRPPGAPDPPCTKAETEEIKNEPCAGSRRIDDIDGDPNLINMVAVGTVSGAVLLTLLAARHF
jgi:hypothetical protein